MLVFIDYEHADGYKREHGQQMLAARTTITYRLEDLSGMHCHLVRYDRVDQSLLDALDTQAIFISGNSLDPAEYRPAEIEAVHGILRKTELPVFGFCGGFQLLGQALGVEVVPLPDRPGDGTDPSVVTNDAGRPFEAGYHPVDLSPQASSHPLLSGLDERPVFRHAHGLHVPQVPDGFENLASTAATPVQLAVHDERRVVGTQFHPEYWTDDHPAGRTLIANFLRWSGILSR